MTHRHIRLTSDEAGVATLVIDRPERLNALSAETLDEMRVAIEGLPRTGARCLLMTGAGRAFSSGADLVTGGGIPEDAGEALERHFNPLVEALFALPMPVVAAVNGPCAGAGCSIALAADIVIAARSAYFLQAFVNLGLIPDAGATWLLPRLVGRARAIEMMMLGERIPAEQAAEWGMIARVVDDADLMAEASALAARLAAGPTVAYAIIRRLARDAGQASLSEALAAERIGQSEAGRTGDFKAGVAAFITRQPPTFEGR
ncbi:2-(1,2-epoxy-1,2-dihydrophenyl)acetyl-CoA isomerase PaaG [Sphingosinicella ginsenosidimutans]|uniref:2-(1,2-epoxy-1,2-dihydrophenyl)acetyl-CoA isomerase n=1 Tax=Allosphingosinicella ginsenosidimutans TaxID=1176539 RepID=A0A5C6TST6_9SPHN|nr:enoyl-CoA hydratase-related protein [Sphingosinicella ginsenosidimutans]TXC63061.1 2-(1,2-epoxy-1,2-dihydrophenyl)acetyl-CoA isomerase [Sphingosinicella ginsenosidimutans]